jgi:hypothetical protein
MSALGSAAEAPETTRAFSYATPSAPAWYACAECAAIGVKLWRPVHSDRSARCAACVERKGGLSAGAVGEDGRIEEPHGTGSYRTDQVAGLLPYVPTEDGEGTWGYSSVPAVAVAWWRSLHAPDRWRLHRARRRLRPNGQGAARHGGQSARPRVEEPGPSGPPWPCKPSYARTEGRRGRIGERLRAQGRRHEAQ